MSCFDVVFSSNFIMTAIDRAAPRGLCIFSYFSMLSMKWLEGKVGSASFLCKSARLMDAELILFFLWWLVWILSSRFLATSKSYYTLFIIVSINAFIDDGYGNWNWAYYADYLFAPTISCFLSSVDAPMSENRFATLLPLMLPSYKLVILIITTKRHEYTSWPSPCLGQQKHLRLIRCRASSCCYCKSNTCFPCIAGRVNVHIRMRLFSGVRSLYCKDYSTSILPQLWQKPTSIFWRSIYD